MKRMMLSVAMLVMVVFGSTAAVAAASKPQVVQGYGVQQTTFKFAFTATRNASGKVGGFFWDTDFGGSQYVVGEVDCLTIQGNSADVGFIVTASNVYTAGTQADFGVTDNGPPVNGQSPDLISDVFGNKPVNPTDCSEHDGPYAIDSGSIVVSG